MARTSGFTAIFLGLCLSRLAVADEPAAFPPATPQQVQQTVERALGYMQTESAAWLKTRKCAACHHVPMVLWSVNEAGRQGYAIDKKYVADTAEATIGSPEKLIASKLFDDPAAPPTRAPSARGSKLGPRSWPSQRGRCPRWKKDTNKA